MKSLTHLIIFSYCLVLLILAACIAPPTSSGQTQPTQLVKPQNTQNVEPTAKRSTNVNVEFNLSSSNRITPEDIIAEVRFYGGGGSAARQPMT